MGNKTRLKIGEFFRLKQKLKDSCKCPPPGYCFTIEHDKEFTPNDIEYCEQVEDMGVHTTAFMLRSLKHMNIWKRTDWIHPSGCDFTIIHKLIRTFTE